MKILYENFDFAELSEAQTRQYIDADSAWRALATADVAAAEVRGSMIWRVQSGRRYLIRVSGTGAQTSLGPASTENERIFERFTARKESAKARQGLNGGGNQRQHGHTHRPVPHELCKHQDCARQKN